MNNRKGFGLNWEEALECYMKGALWTWFEGAASGKTNEFACGDNPACGEWSPKVNYCDPTKEDCVNSLDCRLDVD